LDFQKLTILDNMFSLLFMSYNMMGIGRLQIEKKKIFVFKIKRSAREYAN